MWPPLPTYNPKVQGINTHFPSGLWELIPVTNKHETSGISGLLHHGRCFFMHSCIHSINICAPTMCPTDRLIRYHLSVKNLQSNEGRGHYNIVWHVLRCRFGQTTVRPQKCLSMLRDEELRECPRGGQDEEELTRPTGVREVIQGRGTNMYKRLKLRENLVFSRNCKYLRKVWAQRKNWVAMENSEAGEIFAQCFMEARD